MNEQLFNKLFELQKLVSRKTGLARQIPECLARKLHMERGADLGRHNQLHHGGSWDAEGYSRDHRERDEELHGLRSEYHEICQQIDELSAEIESKVAATV